VLFVYIWLYTFVLAIAWALFVVLKMHSYKFRNFSENIEKITTILFIFLLILSITWYILIFLLGWNTVSSPTVDTSGSYDSVYY